MTGPVTPVGPTTLVKLDTPITTPDAAPHPTPSTAAAPEPDFLRNTRDSYNTIAADYTDFFRRQADIKPLDHAMIAAFAESVRAGGRGPVADLGCGPGRLTVVLRDLGLEAFGVDLSPRMIELARQAHPDLRFEVGSMTALDLPDGTAGGILAWYSIIHLPPDQLPLALAEFHRLLAPGGELLVAFQVRERPRHRDELFGHRIALDFQGHTPETVMAALAAAGLPVHSHLIRAPIADNVESVPQAFLLARKPEAAT